MAMRNLALLALGVIALTSLQAANAELPKEIGRFKLPHAGFVEIFESADESADPLDRLVLFVTTFNAGRDLEDTLIF